MITFKTLTLLTVLTMASCQSLTDKASKATSQEPQEAKVATDTTAPRLADTATGTFVATLKAGIEAANATINDSIIFTATKDQLFVYDNNAHNAWIADGRVGYIPPAQVRKVDTPYFKFTFTRWNFVKTNGYEQAQAASGGSEDINTIVQKARNKNSDALKTFFALHNRVDGEAAESFYYDFWALINGWSDAELLNFVKALSPADKKDMADLLLNKAPLTKVETYYQRHYPETLKEIRTTTL